MATGSWKYKVLDISSYVTVQTGFFRALEENGYSGVCMRLGVGSTKDTKVNAFYAQARAETTSGFKVGFYYVPNPLYSVQANVNYALQFSAGMAFDFGSTDYERTFGVSYPAYRTFMLAWQPAMVAAFNPLLILPYSNRNFMSYIADAPAFRTWIWWIANYYTSTTSYPPAGATPWSIPPQITHDDIGMWQFYSHWHEPYSPSDLDANVAWQELDVVFAQQPAPPQPELLFECLQGGLRIRSAPNATAPILGSLAAGEVVAVDNVGGTDSWVHHSRGWSNVQQGSDVNMEKA